ncbi:phosphonatase-like hydrolase [Nonomuraea sp. NPDC050404]|uniref:phosphonatase-like hydrolase n=1 Tax=Nonomuraea sp. NPDC050404 TaxID=3155783 RepID=UPI003409685F
MIELAVLDIAGTTVEEHGAVYVALEQAVRAAGGAPDAAAIHAWMGAGKREAITALLTGEPGEFGESGESGNPTPAPETVDGAFADFRKRLHAAYADTPPAPLPGVPEAITALRAAGVKVALTTGFDREVTGALLGAIGWDDGFLDAVVCIDDVRAGRPAPYMIFRAMEETGVHDVGRVLVAGDTVRDLRAGTNAGAAIVAGVLTGGQDAAALGAVRHTHLLPGVAAIPALLGLGRR